MVGFLNQFRKRFPSGISRRSSPISIVLTVKFHSVKMLVFHFFTIVKLQLVFILVVASPTILIRGSRFR